VLGYASITFWLFAQLPQVWVNHWNGSVEGLALPFLFNWLCGDITNLVGCLLTDQLPFQAYLATYFTLIDLALMGQFFYYSRQTTTTKQLHARLPGSQSVSGERHRHHHHRRHSRSSLAAEHDQRHQHQPSRQHRASLHPDNGLTASWMTDRSASPGTLKRLAAASRTTSYSADRSKRRKRDLTSESLVIDGSGRPADLLAHSPYPPTGDDRPSLGRRGLSDDNVPADMMESFTSNASNKSSSSTIGTVHRGRRSGRIPTVGTAEPLPTLVGSVGDFVDDMRQPSWSRERLSTRRSPPSPSRTRSVVFLSIWTLFGLGRLLTSTGPGARSDVSISNPVIISPVAWQASSFDASGGTVEVTWDQTLELPLRIQSQKREKTPEDNPDFPPLDYKRIIGRISAWMCVVFYLTSRMPQIWMNFTRRSTEGLSVLLFLAAFHGNLFYVGSVLTSPLVQQEEGYLLESTPFLLGSGGTLAFDLMILFQACIYSKRGSRSRAKRSQIGEEEEAAGLLADDDTLEQRPSRRSTSRGRSSSADRTIRNLSGSRARVQPAVSSARGSSMGSSWISQPKQPASGRSTESRRSKSRRRPSFDAHKPIPAFHEPNSDSTT